MSVHALTINYDNQTRPVSDAFVQLEQDPIDEDINYLTVQGGANALAYFVSGQDLPAAYCTPGVVSKSVYAYPWPASLTNYQCLATKGELLRGVLEEVDIVETINCDFNNILNTTYPVHAIKSYEWITGPWDNLGNPVAGVTLAVFGPQLKLTAKVYGTVSVVYATREEKMRLDIEYNNVVVEGETLDPFLLCVWDGGNEALKIKFADGEENIDCNKNWGGGGGGGGIGDDPYDPGYVSGEDETVKIDYCTMKVKE